MPLTIIPASISNHETLLFGYMVAVLKKLFISERAYRIHLCRIVNLKANS
jgi:hypothetical protein